MSVGRWAAAVLEALGSGPDVLINNCGSERRRRSEQRDRAAGVPAALGGPKGHLGSRPLDQRPRNPQHHAPFRPRNGERNAWFRRWFGSGCDLGVGPQVARGSGLIVNLSSGSGHSTFDATGDGVYSTSKWAVESISKCVAMSLPAPLLCVPFAPGIVRTEMNSSEQYPTVSSSTRSFEVKVRARG